MTLEMKLAEERKEGYAEGVEAGAAEQRAKDEAVISAKESELMAKDEEIRQLKALLEKTKGNRQ